MRVYIVQACHGYDGSEVVATFATREEADTDAARRASEDRWAESYDVYESEVGSIVAPEMVATFDDPRPDPPPILGPPDPHPISLSTTMQSESVVNYLDGILSAGPLTEGDLRSAFDKIANEPPRPPCGSCERPHVVHPKAKGWTSCGNCGMPVER